MNYDKRTTERKKKRMSSKSVKRGTALHVYVLRVVFFALILFVAIAIGGIVGAAKGMIETSPTMTVDALTPMGYATTVLDSNNVEIEKLSTSGSNREEIELSQVPESLKWAFIDIEDERFYEHNGIDPKGILRAIYATLTSDKKEGASTLTQQLLKNNVFESGGRESNNGSLIKRKFQEQYLALEIEKIVDKDTILVNYLNTINLGAGNYGVQSASKYYFGKDVSDLTLSESAVIAGITQNPTGYNPAVYPENNAGRRERVLNNMLENGHISKEEYDEALADDVYSRIQAVTVETASSAYSYFIDALIEEVSRDLKNQLGYSDTQIYNAIYSGGLTIYSTQNTDVQKIIEKELTNEDNFAAVDTAYSIEWRWSVQNAKGNVTNYSEQDIKKRRKDQGEKYYQVFWSKEEADAAVEEFKDYVLSKKKGLETLAETDIIYTLQPQASFSVIDQKTGQVLGLVGGRGDKYASMTLNRATSTTRQAGSTFKVISTYAPAIDAKDYTLASVVEDAPFDYEKDKPVANWWGSQYRGLNTIQNGIKDSMNILAVKTLKDIGPSLGVEYLRNFGLTSIVDDDANLSTALGGTAYGVSNIELCAAYATIANGGVYNEPILYTKITDNNGKIILQKDSSNQVTRTVLKESTADLLTIAMRKVVTEGTGGPCAIPGIEVAGKTGTTSKSYDLLFAGYTPYLTATIWTGFDDNLEIFDGSYHEKLWSKIMSQIHDSMGITEGKFEYGKDIVAAKVCTKSGKAPIKGLCDADPEGSTVQTYYFLKGTEPKEKCDCHVSVNICTSTGKIANENCPHTKKVVYRIAPSISYGVVANSDGTFSIDTSAKKVKSFDSTEKKYALTMDMLKNICKKHNGKVEKPTEDEVPTDDPDITDTPAVEQPTDPVIPEENNSNEE